MPSQKIKMNDYQLISTTTLNISNTDAAERFHGGNFNNYELNPLLKKQHQYDFGFLSITFHYLS